MLQDFISPVNDN